MGKVSEELLIPAPLADVWDLYFERRGWPMWVDQLRTVVSLEEGYPEAGGKLVWKSGPAGRGTVHETVLEHDHRRLHRINFKDDASEGEQTTTFRMEGTGTVVKLDLVYGLLQAGPLGPLTDRLFIRSQMRRMLQRSLQGLRAEAGGPPPAGSAGALIDITPG